MIIVLSKKSLLFSLAEELRKTEMLASLLVVIYCGTRMIIKVVAEALVQSEPRSFSFLSFIHSFYLDILVFYINVSQVSLLAHWVLLIVTEAFIGIHSTVINFAAVKEWVLLLHLSALQIVVIGAKGSLGVRLLWCLLDFMEQRP